MNRDLVDPVPSSPIKPNAARWRDRLRALRRGYLQVFGIPDYARYLEHMAAHHAGEPVLAEREFHAWAIDRKYCRNGPRCC